MSSRRGFLKLIGAAPVALPVAAKEAAVSMGLSGPIGVGAAGQMAGYANSVGFPTPNDPNGEATYLKERLAEIMNPDNLRRLRSEARHEARQLDADIAAMRSISPSAAYAMQIERVVERRVREERNWIDKGIDRLKKMGGWV